MDSNSDRHFYLYAKYWYKRDNMIEDLRRIVAFRCGIDVEYIRKRDVFSILYRVAIKHLTTEQRLEVFFNEMISSIFIPDDAPLLDTLIRQFLLVLSHQHIKDIPFELGDPDPNILPLRHSDLNQGGK